MRDWQLAQVRLHARHKGEPLTSELIEWFVEDYSVNEAEIRAVYAEGLADRASGARCLCPRCELDFERITDHATKRTDYYFKRRDELRAQGLDEDMITRKIDEEIAAGAALRGSTHQ